MMGVPMTPEQRQQMSEKIAARKKVVAASMGKTVEEFDRDARERFAVHRDRDDEAAEQIEPDEGDGLPEVDEEAVLAFIRTRQEIIEKQRARIKALEGKVEHLAFQRDLAEKKNAALRDALAKMRAAAKEREQAGE